MAVIARPQWADKTDGQTARRHPRRLGNPRSDSYEAAVKKKIATVAEAFLHQVHFPWTQTECDAAKKNKQTMKPAPQIESIQLDFDPLPPEREFQCFPEKKMFGLKEQKNETTEQLST